MSQRQLRLEGKVAVVTGAGVPGSLAGTGQATAIVFAREGARVLLVEDETGVSYSIQYLCRNMADLQKYQGAHAPRLQAEVKAKFDGKFVAFRTVLETVD